VKKKSLVTKKAAAKAKGNSTKHVDISKPTTNKVVSAKGLAKACATGQHLGTVTISV
jgi:hypothetical protein